MATTDSLERRIRDLERRLADIPNRWAQPPMVPYQIVIGGGNTLALGGTSSTVDGVKYVTTAPTSIPTAYDPTATPSCIDGVGWGTAYLNGVEVGKVLIGNWVSALQCAIEAGATVLSTRAIEMPVATGGSVLVYLLDMY